VCYLLSFSTFFLVATTAAGLLLSSLDTYVLFEEREETLYSFFGSLFENPVEGECHFFSVVFVSVFSSAGKRKTCLQG